MKIYKFKDCYLNTCERRLVKKGRFVDVTTKTFDVLELLVEKACEIVRKEQILGRVWNDTFVEEGNLSVHIFKLRRLLGTTEAERCIETVHGRGYRFNAHVRSVSYNEWVKQVKDL